MTVVATGRLVHESLKAAEEAEEEGISVEVVDPRTLQPLDEGTIVESVKKTNRCVVAHEAVTRGGFGAEVAAVSSTGRSTSSTRRSSASARSSRRCRSRPRWSSASSRTPPTCWRRSSDGGAELAVATEVKLPRLGQGMESGTIVRWLKGEGEPVKKGEPLYELDTDKVTQEVEAEADGVLLKIVVESGEVEVGKTVAFIGEEGEDVAVRERQAR